MHDAWVLHVDLMGPFAEGLDEHGKVRYALTGILTVPDLTRVADAVNASDDLAAGPEVSDALGSQEGGSQVPMSSLGPPPAIPLLALPPITEGDPDDELRDYTPSEPGQPEDVMALRPEEEEMPETEAEARAAARANEQWQAAALALKLEECPVIEIPLVRMLADKSQQAVSQGLAAMIAHLKYEGFMIRRIHSDRGREFNNGLVQRLCRQREMHQTFTQGDDPQQNGRVESYHARLKAKTRTLLRGASAEAQDWPYAMRTAHAAMWGRALSKLGRQAWQPLPFGTQVKVRTRSWERYGDVWSDRVQDATILAPSVETCKGHVVRTSEGTLLHTTAVFRGSVQSSPIPVISSDVVLPARTREAPLPVSSPAEAEIVVSFPPTVSDTAPTRRISGKRDPATAKVVNLRTTGKAEACALSAAAAAMLSCQPVPFRTASALLVSAPALRELARALPSRLSAGQSSAYLLFGWFKHGGLTGVSAATGMMPGVVELLNTLLERAHPDGLWTTLGLFFNAAAGPHVDRRNAKDTCNYVLPLALPSSEQYLWVKNPRGVALDPLAFLCNDGSIQQGYRLPLRVGEPVCVDPHSLHALPAPLPHEAEQDHVLLVGFSIPWIHRASEQQRSLLQSLRFRLEPSRGGVSTDNLGPANLASVEPSSPTQEKVFMASEEESRHEFGPGLLEGCIVEEGHQQLRDKSQGGEWEVADIQQDVQDDTAAEGSTTLRGAYARRLETRVFEPSDWDRVQRYLVGLGLRHLVESIDALGVDSMEDFGFLYREDLMEAGASKEEAEAILGCTNAEKDGRSDGPAQARAGFQRPSRRIAPERPATAARLVRVPDRANLIREKLQVQELK